MSEIETDAAPGTDVAILLPETAITAAFEGTDQMRALIARIAADVTSEVAEIETAAGRNRVISLAFRVTKAKTTLDKHGLVLGEGLRDRLKAINAVRAVAVEDLSALALQVREPVTQWEEQKAARDAAVKATVDQITDCNLSAADDPERIAAQIEQLRGLDLTESAVGDYAVLAGAKRDGALGRLERALEDANARIDMAAQMAAMQRAIAAANARAEAAEAEAAAARERIEADRAEKERIEVARRQAEADRQAQAKADQEAAAQAERDAAALAERYAAALAGDAKDRADRAAQAEVDRLAAVEREAAAAAQDAADLLAHAKRVEMESADRRVQEKTIAEERFMVRADASAAAARAMSDMTNLSIARCVKIMEVIAGGKIPHVRFEC
jgi:colicin import membrane protein